jgi:hypothetical protein
MIQKFNYFVTKIFDIILYPFSFIHEFWGILFLSILVSFIVLIIYKYVSSPAKIKKTKDQVKANILAIRLYKDFWRVILSSFTKSMLYIFKYFGLNLLPLLIIIPIISPIFFQMDSRYGIKSFEGGEEIIVKAVLLENPNEMAISLLGNNKFKQKMNPVFINAFRDEDMTIPIKEVNWKLEATDSAKTTIKIKINNKTYEKSLVIGDYRGALTRKKLKNSSLEHFLYPAEKLLKPGPELDAIYIRYPGKNISFIGITTHWIVFHLVLVVIIVLGLSKRFGIEF